MPTTAASVGTSSGRKGTEACLYLSSQTELTQTAINKTAHQTEEGGAAQHPSEHPRRFGVSMAIVAPTDPGQSYLLYKLLAASRFPLDPSDPNDAIQAGEADRLPLSLVPGGPMPPEATDSASIYG